MTQAFPAFTRQTQFAIVSRQRPGTFTDTRLSQNVFSGLQQENDDGLVESDDIATSQEN